MRLRLTIATTLAVGILMSGGGAALAFQGLGHGGDNAGAAQYGEGGAGGGNQEEREMSLGPPLLIQGVQEMRQVETRQVETGSSLADTGYAAIPVLLLGAAVLVTGLVLRRRPE
jgi:hypothetical protein